MATIVGPAALVLIAAATLWLGLGQLPGFVVAGRSEHLPGVDQQSLQQRDQVVSSRRGSARIEVQPEHGHGVSIGLSQIVAAAGALGAATCLAASRRTATSPTSRRKPLGTATNPGAVVVQLPTSVVPFLSTAASGPSMLSREQGSMQASLSASRGLAAANSSGRGARIIAYNKNRTGPYRRFKRGDMWFKFSKNFKGRKKNVFAQCRPAVMGALKKKYVSRRLFKRDRRELWIMRVRANCRLHGISYSRFICKLKEADININRKILSQIGIYDRAIFTNIMDIAIPWWQKVKAKKDYFKPQLTSQQIDDLTIPYIEKCIPELYTDANIRFNRQEKEEWIEYTVDMGDPKMWQEVLPKMPELANFQLPDHWIINANAEFEDLPLSLVPVPEGQESPDYIKFMKKVRDEQALDEERAARGEPVWPKRKEALAREDWFKEEPQTWFDKS